MVKWNRRGLFRNQPLLGPVQKRSDEQVAVYGFSPDRLLNNGNHSWTIKDPKAHNLVIGELDLPPNPNKAVNDAFLGGGNIEISPFWNWGSGGTPAPAGPTRDGSSAMSAQSGPSGMMRQADRHAFTKYIVLKKDLSLDDVRKPAVIL